MPVMMWLNESVVTGLTRNSVIQLALVLPAMTLAGGCFFRGAWMALRHRAATMDTLVAIGAGAAFVYSVGSIFVGLIDATYRVHLVFDTSTMVRRWRRAARKPAPPGRV